MAKRTQHTKTRHNEQRHLLFWVLVSQSKKDLALKPAGETWLGGACIPELLRPRLEGSALQELQETLPPGSLPSGLQS